MSTVHSANNLLLLPGWSSWEYVKISSSWLPRRSIRKDTHCSGFVSGQSSALQNNYVKYNASHINAVHHPSFIIRCSLYIIDTMRMHAACATTMEESKYPKKMKW